MDKTRLMKARSCLVPEWKVKFMRPVYISVKHRLYSDDGQWYLAQDTDKNNPFGVCLYKA